MWAPAFWWGPFLKGFVMLDTSDSEKTLLEVNNIEVIYNHVILVLKGVSLKVQEGGITALLGGNGAGKTTTLKAVSNLLHSERGEVTKGSIIYRGEVVQHLDPASVVKKGVIQVMEGRHCFEHLTVEENLLTGAYTRRDSSADIAADLEKVYTYFPRLKERRRAQAGYTSGGEQQMCAIGRALMSRPETILLDEPSMGLAPQLVEQITQQGNIRLLNAEASKREAETQALTVKTETENANKQADTPLPLWLQSIHASYQRVLEARQDSCVGFLPGVEHAGVNVHVLLPGV